MRPLSDHLILKTVCVVMPAAAFSLLAVAQQPPGSGSILEQQLPREQAPLSPAPAPVLPQIPRSKPAVPSPATFRVTAKGFRFSGNSIVPADALSEAVRDLIGTALDLEGLNDAARRIQRYYRERGYFVAVAYVPQQEIRDGIVEIAVLEGHLGEVTLLRDPPHKLRESFARGLLDAHLQSGDYITERALERPLLLLRDLPGADVTAELGPSKTRIGAADLAVKLHEGPSVGGYIEVDNHGNRFSGEYRLGVDLNVNNLAGYGDQLSTRGFLTNENMQFGRLSYAISIGHYGTRLGLAYTTFEYQLGKDFAALGATGEGQVFAVSILHPAVRSRNANLSVQTGIDAKRLEDRIGLTDSMEERRIKGGKLGVAGDLRDKFFGGLTAFSLLYTRGEVDLSPGLLETGDGDAATGPKTAGVFSKFNVDLRRIQRVSDQMNLQLALSAQGASKNLTPAEKMSLGGPNGVRAYPVGEASGDTGYLLAAELLWTIPNLTLMGGQIIASGFMDHGQVRTFEEPPPADPIMARNKRSISGYGVGLSLQKERRFLVRVQIAKPGDKEVATSDSASRDPRAWIQAVKWF